MASTARGTRLTRNYRQRQLAIRAAAIAAVLAVWPNFDLDDIDGSWPALEAALLAIIGRGRSESERQAADYFSAFRAAEGAAGDASVIVPDRPSPALTAATLRVVGPILTKRSISRAAPNPSELALTRLSGSVARQALNGGRDVMAASIAADDAAQGWRRITSGSPCDFCRDLAAAGIIGADVGFPAHDHCSCTQEPVYGGSPDEFRSFLAEFEADVARRSADGSAAGIASEVDDRGFFFTR